MSPVRWSMLHNIGQSPAHYKYFLDNPRPETAAMRIGGYTHQLVLGKNGHEYAVYDGVRRGKEWDAFKSAHAGRSVLSVRESEIAKACSESLSRHTEALELLTYGVTEQQMSWTIANRECTGRPDVRSENSIVDLKITADASPGKFRWHALRMAWHAQLSWYARGAGGCANLYLVAVEPKAPFAVCVYKLDANATEAGTKLWQSWFELLLQCEESGQWPGYSDAIVTLEGYEEEFTFSNEEEVI